ncbi:MAG: hypothetical protein U0165_06570 [Polyangiaceae bacterium]
MGVSESTLEALRRVREERLSVLNGSLSTAETLVHELEALVERAELQLGELVQLQTLLTNPPLGRHKVSELNALALRRADVRERVVAQQVAVEHARSHLENARAEVVALRAELLVAAGELNAVDAALARRAEEIAKLLEKNEEERADELALAKVTA